MLLDDNSNLYDLDLLRFVAQNDGDIQGGAAADNAEDEGDDDDEETSSSSGEEADETVPLLGGAQTVVQNGQHGAIRDGLHVPSGDFSKQWDNKTISKV